jgi:hypothetical protein
MAPITKKIAKLIIAHTPCQEKGNGGGPGSYSKSRPPSLLEQRQTDADNRKVGKHPFRASCQGFPTVHFQRITVHRASLVEANTFSVFLQRA